MSRVLLVVFLYFGFFLTGCSDTDEKSEAFGLEVLTVYKTPSCSCCNDWIEHLQQNGLQVDVVNQDSVAHIKDYYNIPKNGRSCHTAVTDSGLVFEGHVPAKWIKLYMANEIEGTKGLVVPAMPVGSPGMEYQDQFQSYEVFALAENGLLRSYVKVRSYEEQF